MAKKKSLQLNNCESRNNSFLKFNIPMKNLLNNKKMSLDMRPIDLKSLKYLHLFFNIIFIIKLKMNVK